jgi:uncharacterized protein with HEPN domain
MPRKGDQSANDDRVRIRHMRLAAIDAQTYLATRTRSDLDTDSMFRRAHTHALQEIGEAAAKVSSETREAVPDLPWAKIVGMRHILVHVYYDTDADTIWRVATRDVPTMIEVLDKVLGARD